MNKNNIINRIQWGIVVIACLGIALVYIYQRPHQLSAVDTVPVIETVKDGYQVSNPIDFSTYEELNPDVYSYIYIDNTPVDYPILQNPYDDTYYMYNTIDYINKYPGSIYTERATAKDFTDYNTIIYGNNVVSDGTMFHTVKLYLDEDYFKAHPYIYIYTLDTIYQYQVFASYNYDNRHLLYSFDFSTKEGYQTFLNEVYQQTDGVIDDTIKVDSDDLILTLSTGTDAGDGRILLHGVLKQSIECSYDATAHVKENVPNMKEAAKAVEKKVQKKNTKSSSFDLGNELRIALPYIAMIITVLVANACIRKHYKEDQEETISIKGFHNKLRFAGFLCHQLWLEIKGKFQRKK